MSWEERQWNFLKLIKKQNQTYELIRNKKWEFHTQFFGENVYISMLPSLSSFCLPQDAEASESEIRCWGK